MLVFRARIHRMHGRIANREDPGQTASKDPDQLDSEKLPDFDLNSFQNRIYQGINGELM